MTAGRGQVVTRVGAVARHQAVLLARDPGPMIGYAVMGALLITVTRPLYQALGRLGPGLRPAGTDQAAAGMAVMFSLFALKVAAAHMLNERTWHTWDRLRTSPARLAELLAGKALAIYLVILAQQALLFGFSAALFGLHPRAGWPALAACALAWSACVLLLGAGFSMVARTPAQLSAAGDIFALFTTVLGGAIVPVGILPPWLRRVAPASPGYWALASYRAALTGTVGQLGRPLAMLGLFGAIGVATAGLIGAVSNGRWSPHRPFSARRRRLLVQRAVQPPSIRMVSPVMSEAAGEARNTTAPATSTGSPMR